MPDPTETSAAATDPSDDTLTGNEPADDLRRERDDYHDRWLRKTAEFDNYRKRIERERREQSDQAVLNLMQELLLVVDDFDPNIHQAVVHESSPDHREGEVIGEMQKGYMMGDRLLRPAMVKVAKA